MQTETTGTVIVGAGIVGLAIAERLSRKRKDVVVVEQHDGFGRETSSRNSQVVHAGLYYPENTNKTRFCVAGNALMYEFCERHGIDHRKTGKLVPGIDQDEVAVVHERLRQGTANGVAGLRLLTKKEIADYDADLSCAESLLSPTTGIIDAHSVMGRLERLASAQDTVFAYGSKVSHILHDGHRWHVRVQDTDGEELDLSSETVINAAGLSADTIAATSGFDPVLYECEQVPGKGEYFRVAERHRSLMSTLVYPAVIPAMDGSPAKGVHLVLELDGGMKVGPNMLLGQTDYTVDPTHLKPFWEQMHRYLPWLELADMRPDSAGVRPVRPGRPSHQQDYYISEESDKGFPGLVNLIAMGSPALTSCLAIAAHVETLLG
jgi:L-2-hydroxyglutarate oxidase LhgO